LEIESPETKLLVLKTKAISTNNPADGSYYIGRLTIQLAEKSILDIIQDTEANGWFSKTIGMKVLSKEKFRKVLIKNKNFLTQEKKS
jgi:methylmalonyl-CoA mutase N-terminal domain/subunit